MMTIVMIDVEAGKEDLWDRLYEKFKRMEHSLTLEKIRFLYMARCYTHSDISILFDVKDFEGLPLFLKDTLLKMDGVFDIRIFHLFNPKFFMTPKHLERGKYKHFTVTLDVKSDKTEEVFNYLCDFAATEEAAISFMAYTFHSYQDDILFTLLAPDIEAAGKFMCEKIRPIDGVLDSLLWQIEKWQFFVDHEEWVKYLNYYRKGEIEKEDIWDDVFICAC